jgi:hypothetical protein
LTFDRRQFLSDSEVAGRTGPIEFPNGLVKLNFGVDPMNGAGAIDMTGFDSLTVAGHSAWMQRRTEGEMLNPSSSGVTVYIEAAEHRYTLGLECTPPTAADTAARVAFHTECQRLLDHILASFQVGTL